MGILTIDKTGIQVLFQVFLLNNQFLTRYYFICIKRNDKLQLYGSYYARHVRTEKQVFDSEVRNAETRQRGKKE